jgi:hypothetical protein
MTSNNNGAMQSNTEEAKTISKILFDSGNLYVSLGNMLAVTDVLNAFNL